MSARQQGGTALKAVLFLMLAILCFDAMSVLVRLLLPRYSVQELSAYRNVVGVLPSLALMIYTRELRLRGTVLRITRWRLALLRGGIVAMAQFLFYSGIGYLELATVSALGQTNALFVVLLSVLLLGERVGPWRIFALFWGLPVPSGSSSRAAMHLAFMRFIRWGRRCAMRCLWSRCGCLAPRFQTGCFTFIPAWPPPRGRFCLPPSRRNSPRWPAGPIWG